MSTRPTLTFLGAAGTVTGSRFLIDTGRARVLIDAGLFQGLKPLRLRNWAPFGVRASDLDSIVVTHAHIDHLGYLPVLVRDGFGGRVHMTPATAELAAVVLPDSGHLQEEEAEYANRVGFSKHRPALPLYTEADALRSLNNIAMLPFSCEREVGDGVHVSLKPAGHILGSATVTVRLAGVGDRRIVFSGDLGRPRHPLLVSPAPIGDADVVVCESTYGDQCHDVTNAIERLRDVIVDTAARGGAVLIPAFAVDRTEVVLYYLDQLATQGAIPQLPIYVDSPMALASLGVYRRAVARGDVDIEPTLGRTDPFGNGEVVEVKDVEHSKSLASLHGPMIIVSASGMATGGRVVHHLQRLLPDRRNAVVLVGFQAPGTRGALLADGAREIKMLGRYVRDRAEVVQLDAFSSHADQSELLDWLGTANKPPETVYLVHGEEQPLVSLRQRINRDDDWNAVVARPGERVRL